MESMKKWVFYAAKSGMSVALRDHLSELSEGNTKAILSELFEDDGQKCTPLLIACANGHEKSVRTILKFNPDLEQEGMVKFDGYVIEGASPLWCAAGAGHLGVVKMLVRAGADVNHRTKTYSTPLRAACFEGRLDIIKYLTEHGANIHITNKYNNTCLMIAAYKGHEDVVQFLLELGANPNEKAQCGATALHFAAECGHVKIVDKLLLHGAVMNKNEHGMTPLLMAAERTRADVVTYLIEKNLITKQEKIDSLELLGASFGSDKENYSIFSSYKYLMEGMKERYCDSEVAIEKPAVSPIPAYENRVECKTINELAEIQNQTALLHLECLVIRERILGSSNPEVPHPIIFRGAVFADNARFDRCLQLWLHALHLKQSNGVSVVKDLLRFAQVFSQMIHVGVSLEFEVVERVLQATIFELEKNYIRLKNPEPKDDIEVIKEEIEKNMITSLYLIMIAKNAQITSDASSSSKIDPDLCCLDYRQSSANRDKDSRIHYIVYKLVRINATTKTGRTLLHLAVNPDTPVDDFHTNHVCRFPCALTTKLLISCGANVNSMDDKRNTPLHLIVPYKRPVSDFMTLHNIIMALVEAGAHMDTVNEMGATPFDSATTGVAGIILRSQKKLSLKCQAARVVKMNGIPYKNLVPHNLEAFIELHGPTHVDVLNVQRDSQSL